MGYCRNIGHNLITQILKIVFGMLTGILVARALGPSGQGYIAYLILVFTLLGNFGHFGITSAVAFYQKRSGFDRAALFSTNSSVLGLIALILAVLILMLRASGFFLMNYSWFMIAGGIAMMTSYLFLGHDQAWLTGDERIILNNQIGLISFFLKSGLILLLWLWGLLNVHSFFWITVASLFLWFILIRVKLKENYVPLISLPVLKAEYIYGGVAWASTLFAFLQYRADQIMIKQYLGTADLGIYTIAVTIAELLFLLPIAINTALTGRLYNLAGNDDGRTVLARTTRISMAICLALCLPAIPGSFLIPYIYGAPYAGATQVMLILIPGILFACVPKIVAPWFFSTGRPKIHLRITLGCLLINISLNFFLIPIWGILGAALASTISYLFYGLYYLIIMKYKEGFSFMELLIPQPIDLAIWKRRRS